MAERARKSSIKESGVDIERKPALKLYTYLDNDGGFTPPTDIESLMESINSLADDYHLEDYELGQYFAIQELLATPTALLQEKATKLLHDIVEIGIQNHLDELNDTLSSDDEDENIYDNLTPKTEDKSMGKHHNHFNKPEDNEDETLPVSLEDINTWYRTTQGYVVQGWYNMTHTEKYELYIEWQKEQERLNRDLTDEEMLEELEGESPEQSD